MRELLRGFSRDRLMLPCPLEVTNKAHGARDCPGCAGRKPHAPKTDDGDLCKNLCKGKATCHLGDSVDHGEGGVSASVHEASWNIDHAKAKVTKACDPERADGDPNGLLVVLDKKAHQGLASQIHHGDHGETEDQRHQHGLTKALLNS